MPGLPETVPTHRRHAADTARGSLCSSDGQRRSVMRCRSCILHSSTGPMAYFAGAHVARKAPWQHERASEHGGQRRRDSNTAQCARERQFHGKVVDDKYQPCRMPRRARRSEAGGRKGCRRGAPCASGVRWRSATCSSDSVRLASLDIAAARQAPSSFDRAYTQAMPSDGNSTLRGRRVGV